MSGIEHAFGPDRKERILRERGLLAQEPEDVLANVQQEFGQPALTVNAVRMTTKLFEEMRDANPPEGYTHGGAIGALFGIPVIIDDTLPEEPGFEVRYTDG